MMLCSFGIIDFIFFQDQARDFFVCCVIVFCCCGVVYLFASSCMDQIVDDYC